MRLLCEHAWRGNVRELENTIERAVTLSAGTRIDVADLPVGVIRGEATLGGVLPSVALTQEVPEEGIDLEATLDAYERLLIEKALARGGGVKKRAAALLRITFRSLRYRLVKLGMAAADDGAGQD